MDTLAIKTIPINALLLVSTELRAKYIERTLMLPQRTKDVLFSGDTGAFVRGLAKSYDIDINLSPKISLAILFAAIGEKTFAQLPGIFSSELGLPPDKAQKMALEIEKDIFGPIKGELDAFLSRKIAPQSRDTATLTLRLAPLTSTKPNNLLDLKEIAAARRQEQLNAQPPQKQLPKRPMPQRIAPPRAPLPPPLTPPRAGGENAAATPAPKFPLPAKPAVSPIDFSKY